MINEDAHDSQELSSYVGLRYALHTMGSAPAESQSLIKMPTKYGQLRMPEESCVAANIFFRQSEVLNSKADMSPTNLTSCFLW